MSASSNSVTFTLPVCHEKTGFMLTQGISVAILKSSVITASVPFSALQNSKLYFRVYG